jgi:hypothetical protein
LVANIPIADWAVIVIVVGSLLAAELVGSTPTANAAQCEDETDAQSVCAAAIFGRVVWPDGEPAGNGRIMLVADSSASSDATAAIQVHTDPTGRYEATICPCAKLVAFLVLGDGGSCRIPLTAAVVAAPRAEFGSANGLQVQAGGQVSWIASRGPCGIADLDQRGLSIGDVDVLSPFAAQPPSDTGWVSR